MAVPIPILPEGTRVRVRRSVIPQDPSLTGRTGVVLKASEYTPHMLTVALDGEPRIEHFAPGELEVAEPLALAPEREAARQRRSLP
jgi:hypothetical protein